MSRANPQFPLIQFLSNRSFEEAVIIYDQRIADAKEVYSLFNKEFDVRPCPACGSRKFKELEKFHDTYGVAACIDCQTQFVNPAPSLKALSHYYNKCKCNLMLGTLYRKRAQDKANFVISERTAYVISLLREMPIGTPLEILEIGCSSGGFLGDLKQGIAELLPHHKVSLSGIDIDENAIKTPVDPELNLIAMPVEDFVKVNKKQFDLVIHFELIEHLIDPFEFMTCVHRLLKPDGLHMFHTPNILGFENVACPYNSLRLIAHAIFPPMHLNAFSTQNIGHFALRSGFGIVSIDTPGKLDLDMVRLCTDRLTDETPYAHLDQFNEEQLGIIQAMITDLRASSHMRCTLRKI